LNILHIDSSITGDQSASRELTRAIVETLTAEQADASVIYRDLAADPLDHITLPAFAEEGSAQALAQFKAADVVVIGAPMYNFTIPSQLKAWIDRILVAGGTFRYTANGVEGLSGDKRVIIAIARGGFYGEGSAQESFEFVERYLTATFAFIGVPNVEFVIAEGLKVSDDARGAAMDGAVDRISTLTQLAA